MTRLTERLEGAVGRIDAGAGVDGVLRRVRTRRRARRLRAVVAIVVVALLGTAAAVAVTRRHNTSRDVRVQPPAAAGTDILVFDDGYHGVLSVDPAERVAVRRRLDGQRAGDQPFRLILTGDAFVVGWDDVYAVPLATGRSRPIGKGVVIPAEVPGRVWLTPFGAAKTYRLVDLHGRTLLEGSGPAGGSPDPVAIPGGLAFAGPRGLILWDARTNAATVLGSTGARPGASFREELAWSQHGRTGLMLTSTSSLASRLVPLPRQVTGVDVSEGQFSPDGRLFAVQASFVNAPNSANGAVVIDVAHARVVRAIPPMPPYMTFAWGTDDDHLYLAAFGQNQGTTIRRVDVASGRSSDVRLPVDVVGTFRVAARSDAPALLAAPSTGSIADCQPSAVQLAGRIQPCRFRF